MGKKKNKAKGEEKKTELKIVSPFLNTDQAASYLGVAKGTIYQWIHKRKSMNFPVRRVGKKPVFMLDDLKQWVEQQTVIT